MGEKQLHDEHVSCAFMRGQSYALASSTVCLYQNFGHCWLDAFKFHCVCILEIYFLCEAMIRQGILKYKMHQKNIVVLEAQEKCSISKPSVMQDDSIIRALLLYDFIVGSQKTHFISRTSQKLCKNLPLESRPVQSCCCYPSLRGRLAGEQDASLSISSPLESSFAQLILFGAAAPANALTTRFVSSCDRITKKEINKSQNQ